MQTRCSDCGDEHVCHADQDQFFMERLQSMKAAQLKATEEAKDNGEQDNALWYQARAGMLDEVMTAFEVMHPGSGIREWPEIKP